MTFTFALRLLAVLIAWGGMVLPVGYQLFKGVNGYTPITRAFFVISVLIAWNITRSLWHLHSVEWDAEQVQYQLETSFYQFGIVVAGVMVVWFKGKSEK